MPSIVPRGFIHNNKYATKYGLYTKIGKTNAFGYGYTNHAEKPFSEQKDNYIYNTSGIFVVDPSEQFLLGVESRGAFNQDTNFLLKQ
ncbi:MAG: hypothetical protein RR563_04320 [Acinetobacter sp.]